MYFHTRFEAGELLANRLDKYRFENTTVLALSPGGVMVGEAIARRLHCTLSLLMTERIVAPGDPSLVLGTMTELGDFRINNLVPASEMEEYLAEFRGYIEEEKLRKLYQMTHVVGEGGRPRPEVLIGRNVIIVTDGVKNGLSYDAAFSYLRHVKTEKLIGAIPVGPAEVIERLNLVLDELYYLYIPDNFLTPSHYYDEKDKIDPSLVIESINQVVAKWQ